MAFALTGFKAYGERASGATRKHVTQCAELYITALAADVALDVSNFSGTFWTAAVANATTGSVATQALVVLAAIQNNAYQIRPIEIAGAINYTQQPATGALQYTVTAISNLPSVSFNAANGPTAYTLIIKWLLHDGIEATVSDLGAAI